MLLSYALSDLKRQGLVANPQRSVWSLTEVARTPPEPATAPVHTDRLTLLRAMPYRDYLFTPEWRDTRAAALVRAGHACSMDASHVHGLEVHHNNYARVGAELARDLTVLCHDCHVRHHVAQGRPGPRVPARPSIGPPSAGAQAT